MPEEKKKASKSSSSSLAALIVHHSVTVILVIAMLVLGVWGYITFRKNDFFYTPEETGSSTQRYLVASQLQRIELAADAYQKIHESPPISLESLVEEGLLTSKDLSYPSRDITYELQIDGSDIKITYKLERGGASLDVGGGEAVLEPAKDNAEGASGDKDGDAGADDEEKGDDASDDGDEEAPAKESTEPKKKEKRKKGE
jgi:competence protein ComGC